jgi:RHS repeat-associated protein
VRHERHDPPHGSVATDFDWLGDIYVGRRQDQAGGGSPFRETVRLDPFGAPLAWEYRAIDLDQQGNPADPTEGTGYCGGAWRTECGRALLTVDALRYASGKIASLNWSFGYPLVQGGTFVPLAHPTSWRGYGYTRLGELDRTWEHDGVTSVVRPQGLQTHSITPADISALGAASVAWQYDRLPAGDIKAIRRAASGTQRWALTTPRGPGHQLSRVQVDYIPHALMHDAEGNVGADNARSFAFDSQGRLAAVLTNGAVVEAYAYDGSGRLSALFQGTGNTPSEIIVHDGESMVASFPSSGAPNWQAAWGPGTDRLIELRSNIGNHIPLLDHRNTIVATWVPGPNGGVSGTAEYNPEGRLLRREPDGAMACREAGVTICRPPGGIPFGFVTAWRSFTSGLLYLRQRWYSPGLGEFLSHDPAGYIGDGNPYAYAAFEPINNWDPSGLDPKSFVPTRADRAELKPERTRGDPDTSRGTNVFEKQTTPSTPSSSSKAWPWARLNVPVTTGSRQDYESREGRRPPVPHWSRPGGPPKRAFVIPWQTSRRPRTSVPGPSSNPPAGLLRNYYIKGQYSRIMTRANARNYAYLFRRWRPDLPPHWHVHHSLPLGYIHLFNPLNINEPFFLRGVDPVVHEHIHREWSKFHTRHFGNPTPQQIVNFAKEIDARYSNAMIFSDAPFPLAPYP